MLMRVSHFAINPLYPPCNRDYNKILTVLGHHTCINTILGKMIPIEIRDTVKAGEVVSLVLQDPNILNTSPALLDGSLACRNLCKSIKYHGKLRCHGTSWACFSTVKHTQIASGCNYIRKRLAPLCDISTAQVGTEDRQEAIRTSNAQHSTSSGKDLTAKFTSSNSRKALLNSHSCNFPWSFGPRLVYSATLGKHGSICDPTETLEKRYQNSYS